MVSSRSYLYDFVKVGVPRQQSDRRRDTGRFIPPYLFIRVFASRFSLFPLLAFPLRAPRRVFPFSFSYVMRRASGFLKIQTKNARIETRSTKKIRLTGRGD